ncbi:MAG TPA: HAMP domain-containing sensor histidine kinase [Gemmatimonadales bacterium]
MQNVSSPPDSWLTSPRLDRLLIEANWAAVRRQLARGMSHELRGPLHALLLASQSLDPRTGEEELQLFLRTVDGATQGLRHAAEWVSSLTDAVEPAALEPVVLGDVVQRVIDLSAHYREASGVETSTEPADGLPAVRGSPLAIEQALLNLVLNGRDAAAAGREGGDAGSVRFSATLVDDTIEIAVADNGPGVVLEDRERIFEPFYTTKGASRLGIGLPATVRLLAPCGGTVALDPGPATGARFLVRLPVWRREGGWSRPAL